MRTETVFHSYFAIVKDYFSRNAAKDFEGANKSIQKALFVLTVISKYDRPAAIT